MEADPLTGYPGASGDDTDPDARRPSAYLVILRKGPTWDRRDIEPFCRLLSRRFTGEVWAFGSYSADAVVGRMRLRVVKERPLKDTANRLLFVRHALGWIEQLRAASPSRLALISLEPYTGGLLGLYAAKRTRGVLICEINGVYANRHNSSNSGRGILNALRARIRRLVGGFVLRNATAVRLLFPAQLQGFSTLPRRVIARQFFDRSDLSPFYTAVEEPFILSVGFPFHVKGFDILCKAFLKIADKFPDFKLVLVGFRVPEEVRTGGFEHPQIEARPGLPHDQVADLMARCTAFALPSRTEAMGRVLLEAAAAGKCRVATDVDGIPTVVRDGVDGLLVSLEDIEGLAAALERVMLDSDLRRRLGDAARSRVHREFTDDAYLDHYENLVSAALQQRAI